MNGMRKLLLISMIALAAASCLPPLRAPATIRAMVLSADASSNQLVLDKGKTDGVRKGMIFVIRFATGGRSIPNAKVTQVEPTRCYTTYPGVTRTPVQIGDEAIQVK
jgi:cell shape-determining protein MreC